MYKQSISFLTSELHSKEINVAGKTNSAIIKGNLGFSIF